MNHANKCLLAQRCSLANSDSCSPSCGHFVRMHGFSGTGGRSGSAGAPADYRMLTLKNSPAREEQAKTYATIDKYVATFERQFEDGSERIKSLYLWSESPGNGKTTTATALLNEWIIANYLGCLRRNRQSPQSPAVFLDVNAFQTDYNLATMTNSEAEMAKIKATIQRTQTAPFVVMDDVGIRSSTEAFKSYVHAIVNYRTTNGLPTVFTSNLPIEEMAVVFDARLYDRMRDQCGVLKFEGTSKRGIR